MPRIAVQVQQTVVGKMAEILGTLKDKDWFLALRPLSEGTLSPPAWDRGELRHNRRIKDKCFKSKREHDIVTAQRKRNYDAVSTDARSSRRRGC